MCSRPVCFSFVPLCREGDAKIASFSNSPLFTHPYWPIYILAFLNMFWSNWSMAEQEHLVGGNAGILVSAQYAAVSFPLAEWEVR